MSYADSSGAKRSADKEGLAAARKRHAGEPFDKDPPPAPRGQPSRSHQELPVDLIAEHILPFIQDRGTWNSLITVNKDFHRAGKTLTPPWPTTRLDLDGGYVNSVAFSPCECFLACATRKTIHVLDPHGKSTHLDIGHPRDNHCPTSFSFDGRCLASGSADRAIRVWFRESFQTTSSQDNPRNTSTQTHQQPDKILLGHQGHVGNLAFSSTDSNLLASAESSARTGAIKLWDVSEQACVYTFNSDRGNVLSMSFFPGKDKVCLTAVTTTGSWIRLRRRNELLDDFTSEIIDHPDFSDCWLSVLSRCGSFLVTATSQHRISVYNLNTMKRTQSADFLGFRATCIAISPDNKWLAIGDSDGRTRLLQADDLTIEMDLPAQSPLSSVCRVAFDPSSQILASTGTYGVCWLQSLPSRGTFD